MGMNCPLLFNFRLPEWMIVGKPITIQFAARASADVSETLLELNCSAWSPSRVWARIANLKEGSSVPGFVEVNPVGEASSVKINLAATARVENRIMRGKGFIPPPNENSTGLSIYPSRRGSDPTTIVIEERAFYGSYVETVNIAPNKTVAKDAIDIKLTSWISAYMDWEEVASVDRLGDVRGHLFEVDHPNWSVGVQAGTTTWPDWAGSWIWIDEGRFWMRNGLVTQRFWSEVMGDGFGSYLACVDSIFLNKYRQFLGPDLPVFGLKYQEACAFCDNLTAWWQTRGTGRNAMVFGLPTQRQWNAVANRWPRSPRERKCLSPFEPISDNASDAEGGLPHGIWDTLWQWLSTEAGEHLGALCGGCFSENLPTADCRKEVAKGRRSYKHGLRIVAVEG